MRCSDWHRRFHEEVEAARLRPWVWGEHDCCFFVARVLDAFTVEANYVARLRQRFRTFCQYSSEVDAHVIISEGGGLHKLVGEFLSEEIPWGWAKMGDVVLIKDAGDQEVLGISEGGQILIAKPHGGVQPVQPSRAICAWRVN